MQTFNTGKLNNFRTAWDILRNMSKKYSIFYKFLTLIDDVKSWNLEVGRMSHKLQLYHIATVHRLGERRTHFLCYIDRNVWLLAVKERRKWNLVAINDSFFLIYLIIYSNEYGGVFFCNKRASYANEKLSSDLESIDFCSL